MTEQEFCKKYSEHFGEQVDDIWQIEFHEFNGSELYEFAQTLVNKNDLLHVVSKRYLLEVIASKGNSLHCSVYDDCEKAQQMYGVLEHEWKGSMTEVRLTAFNDC